MSAPSSADAVLGAQATIRDWQEDLYRDLHAHPELGHQESRTAGLVAAGLRDLGFEVHEHVGGTGVVGVLANGDGPVVLMRADMDALPVAEATGLPYASTARATDADGNDVPVMHACGHDVHVACLAGAARLLAGARSAWSGTFVALFQPAEELADGARGMAEDNLASLVPTPDVALAQHVLAYPAGTVGTHPGPFLSLAESVRVTVYGRGSHGSMPHLSVDPAVLAAMIVVRLQAVVSREVAPGEFAVLTVGRIAAGTKSNIIDDHAVLELNLRAYSEETRAQMAAAIERIVRAECAASGSPKDPEFETYDRYPLTDNDPAVTARVATAFQARFGEAAGDFGRQTASEDFTDIPTALKVPYTYWALGGIDPDVYKAAAERGTVNRDIPGNHSPMFAPVIRPTLETGTAAAVVAALAWLGG
ncbi:amidohydrolase [Georgenia sp. SYP-B2076]|uniref:amidohydrolase n=1 Tax=Georgenia sp. SYP-B2076 TaxID=2495881 RepID=UPI000F8D48DE|nr:amidohydrolase [Georgenia sp. SYP-B2076]